MADWFPATRAMLQRKLAPHLPPHPVQAVFGAALSALVAALVLGVIWVGVRGALATWDGVHYLAAQVQRQAPSESPAHDAAASTAVNASTAVKSDGQTGGASPNVGTPPAISSSVEKRLPKSPDPVVLLPLGISQEVREKVRPDVLPFHEGAAASFSDGVRQTDYALVQTLARMGLDRTRADYLYGAPYSAPSGEGYFFQRIRLYLGGTTEDFVQALQESLDVWAERTTLRMDADGVLRLAVDGHPTHELFFTTPGAVFVPPPPPGDPILTIVIDDLGNSMEAVRSLLDLDLPVTFSIMPRAPHAAETAMAAHKAGQEVLIHQPMEPRQAPYVSPGPGALTVSMAPEDMRRVLRDNIARVPHAVGMNNHMGSRLTADEEACRLVSREASGAGLFILDSMTYPTSIFQTEAFQLGVRALRRDIFLDDGTPTKSAVLQSLREAERVARRRGYAVAIGHPRPETLAALKEWARERDGSVAIAPLRYQNMVQPGTELAAGQKR